jgi:hypothetical protein
MTKEKYNLFEELIKSSFSKNWNEAQFEWQLDSVIDLRNSNEYESCLCGHFPIKKLCFIKNSKTGAEKIVGSCCAKKFDNDWIKIFDGIDKIHFYKGESTNYETLEFANKKGYINDWEFSFYLDIIRKRNLSEKQLEYKSKINNKLLLKIKK